MGFDSELPAGFMRASVRRVGRPEAATVTAKNAAQESAVPLKNAPNEKQGMKINVELREYEYYEVRTYSYLK